MRQFALILLTICQSFMAWCLPASDTIRLYYAIGKADINTSIKQRIDSLVYFDVLVPGKKIGIVGYCDYLGSEEQNQLLSENRAKNIQGYLLSQGIKAEDIEIVTGKGEVAPIETNGTPGHAPDRRVDIILGGFKKKSTRLSHPIDISKLKKNEAFALNNIFFYPGRHKVKEESLGEIQKLYTILIDNPQLKIRIEGHICCNTDGTPDGYDYDSKNYILSVNRAKEIYDYLRIRKIDTSRVEYAGFGKTRPLVYPEKNEDDENKNRRVEIRVLDK